MERSHSRGQSTAELLIVMLLFSAILLTFLEYSDFEVLRGTILSKEIQ